MSGKIEPSCRFWTGKANCWGKFTCVQFPQEIPNEKAFDFGACECYSPIDSGDMELLVLADVRDRDASLVRDAEGRMLLMPAGKKLDLAQIKLLDSRNMLLWKSRDLRYIVLTDSDDPDDYELI
jgi:hypothetical protein